MIPNKRFGQHFLKDENIAHQIVSISNIKPGALVLEIGPGLGILTHKLLKSAADEIISIEIDRRFESKLQALQQKNKDKLSFYMQDALKINIADITNKDIMIIANLPYNIGTALLLKWMNECSQIKSITVMLQKEVADRIVAKPHSKSYGRISVLIQNFYHACKKFDVSPSAFHPIPQVISSVIYLSRKEDMIQKESISKEFEDLKKITAVFFMHRRKKIKHVFKKYFSSVVEEDLQDIEINFNMRAEEITQIQYKALVQRIQNNINVL
ncbi:MAG: 16S rRNA (adenine(1518)-N(6)/adenine(1519)-N(6))-dimethyltransferase RsmA [Proteobacteria bacterium]|nr:16S rRNA (adenine(1518)-N(6)/adenine(1519)-N(6))-dimethyltransferase RsmA [Pseudomonadota bacterium]